MEECIDKRVKGVVKWQAQAEKNIKKNKCKEEEGAGTEHPKGRDNQNLSVRSTLKKGKKVELNHYIS